MGKEKIDQRKTAPFGLGCCGNIVRSGSLVRIEACTPITPSRIATALVPPPRSLTKTVIQHGLDATENLEMDGPCSLTIPSTTVKV